MSRAFNLDRKRFRLISNSKEDRVYNDPVFTFSQSGDNFAAIYSGAGFTDGHLIGKMTDSD